MFERAGAVVLGISPQNVDSHERFAAAEGFTFPLLSDEDLAVGQACLQPQALGVCDG